MQDRVARDAPGTHGSTASTLHGIAEVYWKHLSERWRPLRIPGCPGRTYCDCFRPLMNTTGYVPHEPSMLFAPIRFRRPIVRGGTIIIELVLAIWLFPCVSDQPTSPDAVHRVSFCTGQWSDRDNFRREVFDAVAHLMGDHNDADRTWKAYLLFVGDQDADNPATFLVDDHCLTCFFRLHRNDYRNL